MNKLSKLLKKIKSVKITPKLIFKAFLFLLLFALYHVCEYGNSWAGSSRGAMWQIGHSVIP